MLLTHTIFMRLTLWVRLEVEAVYHTNVFGLLNVTRAVLPFMRQARAGRILNISSIGGCAQQANGVLNRRLMN